VGEGEMDILLNLKIFLNEIFLIIFFQSLIFEYSPILRENYSSLLSSSSFYDLYACGSPVLP
jgi:hypothetical protein